MAAPNENTIKSTGIIHITDKLTIQRRHLLLQTCNEDGRREIVWKSKYSCISTNKRSRYNQHWRTELLKKKGRTEGIITLHSNRDKGRRSLQKSMFLLNF